MNGLDETAETRPNLYQALGRYRERLPAAPLRPHVDRVWTNELYAAAAVDVIPDGCIDIYWTGSRLLIAGPNTRIVTATVGSAADMVGIRFNPGVAPRWLGISAAELVNAQPPLEDVWGRRGTAPLSAQLADAVNAATAAAILERALVGRLHHIAPADPMIGATVTAIARDRRNGKRIVRRLIDEYGWSERSLRRRCEVAFGYGPKTLQRILRFQRFLRLLASSRAPLSVLAVDAGYADQAHLAREVRRLSGKSPRALMADLRT